MEWPQPVPKYLQYALGEIGVREYPDVPGDGLPDENERITAYQGFVGLAPDDETPWCAAFVHWALREAGVLGTGAPNARSYLDWGRECEPKLGAVVVFWRNSPRSWQGHVAFLLDHTHPEYVYVVGGNQGNRVSVQPYPRRRVLSYREPIPSTQGVTT